MFRPRERAFKQFKCPRPQCVKNVLKSHEKIEKQNCNCYESDGITTKLRNTELFAIHMKPFRYRTLSVCTINTLAAIQFFISKAYKFRN